MTPIEIRHFSEKNKKFDDTSIRGILNLIQANPVMLQGQELVSFYSSKTYFNIQIITRWELVLKYLKAAFLQSK